MLFSSLLHFYIYFSPFERAIYQKQEGWWSCKTYDETVSTRFRPILSSKSYLLSQNTSAECTLVTALSVGVHNQWHTGEPSDSWKLHSGLKHGTDVELQPDVCVCQPLHGHGQEGVHVPCTWACVSVLRGDLAGKVPCTACLAKVFISLCRRGSPRLAAGNFFQLVQWVEFTMRALWQFWFRVVVVVINI